MPLGVHTAAVFIDVRTAIRLPLKPTMAINIVSILQGSSWHESIDR